MGVPAPRKDQKLAEPVVKQASNRAVSLAAENHPRLRGAEESKRVRIAKVHPLSLRLVQKYYNFMKELETKHKQEVIRLEKSFKVQCTRAFIQLPCPSHALRFRPAYCSLATDGQIHLYSTQIISSPA